MALRLLVAAVTFCAALYKPADQIVGTMKGLVDGYMQTYDTEITRFADADTCMKKVAQSMEKDKEAKERAVDERIRMEAEHQEKLKSLVKFVRTLDYA